MTGLMDTRPLGHGGPQLSVVGLGCNNFGMKMDAAAARAVVDAALEVGITHFDTAEMYGGGRSEEFLGEALRSHRDEVVIATKYRARPADEPYEPGALARRIREGCEISLGRLGTERIDLYYQHHPDPEAPHEEALETLHELVEEGKVLHLASSNLNAEQMRAWADVTAAQQLTPLRGIQIAWSLLQRDVEGEVIPTARELGQGVVPYFPLASGMLTGKYQRNEPFPEGSRLESMSYFAKVATDENFDRVDALTAFAAARGHTLLELAFSWLLAQDGVASVIAGATTPAQVRANAAAASWKLDADDLSAIP